MNLFHRILDRPSAVAPRRWVVQVHLWVGLIAGLLISVLGFSGSLIVFNQEIYRASNRPLMRVEPAGTPKPLEEQAEQTMRANPGGQINLIELPRDARDSTQFSVRFEQGRESRSETVYVNPYTAEVLIGSPRRLRWLDWIENLHTNLLSGRTGRLVDGIAAAIFLVLCISGTIIWWPGRPHWRRNLWFSGKLDGWPWALGFHKAVGFWSVLLMAMFAITGISFTWNVSKIVFWMTDSSPRESARVETDWKSGDKLLPLDAYLASFAQAAPESKPVYMDLPFEKSGFVRIGFRMPGDLEREGSDNSLFLDPGTGAVLRVDLLRREPIGERILSSFSALHYGRFGIGPVGELPIKITWVGMGLLPGTLFYTGFWPWWNRAVRRRWEGRDAR